MTDEHCSIPQKNNAMVLDKINIDFERRDYLHEEKETYQTGEEIKRKDKACKTAEVITDSIVDEQKIDVDAISGATNSSTVIKKRLRTL